MLQFVIEFCGENKLLSLISPQLEVLDCLADRYAFSAADRAVCFETAIKVLSKVTDDQSLLLTLKKLLFKLVVAHPDPAQIPDKVRLLYLLAAKVSSIAQYNPLVEIPAYATLLKVPPLSNR